MKVEWYEKFRPLSLDYQRYWWEFLLRVFIKAANQNRGNKLYETLTVKIYCHFFQKFLLYHYFSDLVVFNQTVYCWCQSIHYFHNNISKFPLDFEKILGFIPTWILDLFWAFYLLREFIVYLENTNDYTNNFASKMHLTEKGKKILASFLWLNVETLVASWIFCAVGRSSPIVVLCDEICEDESVEAAEDEALDGALTTECRVVTLHVTRYGH